MENTKSQSRRSFLKSSMLTGGGLMLSFTWLSNAKAAEKAIVNNASEQWSELTSYIKITPDNIVKIFAQIPNLGKM
jgi:isoquinoline 1-oxidoreductase beta subunit